MRLITANIYLACTFESTEIRLVKTIMHFLNHQEIDNSMDGVTFILSKVETKIQ